MIRKVYVGFMTALFVKLAGLWVFPSAAGFLAKLRMWSLRFGVGNRLVRSRVPEQFAIGKSVPQTSILRFATGRFEGCRFLGNLPEQHLNERSCGSGKSSRQSCNGSENSGFYRVNRPDAVTLAAWPHSCDRRILLDRSFRPCVRFA